MYVGIIYMINAQLKETHTGITGPYKTQKDMLSTSDNKTNRKKEEIIYSYDKLITY